MTTKKGKIKFGLREIEKIRGPMTFARLLMSFRVTEGMSQIELAKKLKLSRGNICDFEKGRKIPSASKAAEIAKTLGEIPQYWVEVAVQDMLESQKLDYVVKIEPRKKRAA